MRVRDISNGAELRPLKIPAREVPHAVIEANYTCNRRCAACYNLSREGVKSFQQVMAEVDLVLSKRNLETLSILGGEPTLHPRLPDIVRYIKGKKLVCQVLTNGLVLFEDGGDHLLDQLVQAGVDRVVLHVDCGQGLTEATVERMRETLFDKFERRGLYFGLAITLYKQNVGEIPGLMRRYAHYRFFDGVLGTVVRETDSASEAQNVPPVAPDLARAYKEIAQGLGVQPSSYLPSSLDDREVRWLIYFYYLNAVTGVTTPVSPRLSRLVRRAWRMATGRHLFAATLRPSFSRACFMLSALAETLLNPARLPEFVRLAVGSSTLNNLRFHYIVLQAAPQVNNPDGQLEICYHCPDATVRDGKLAPVCLADWMSPRAGMAVNGQKHRALAETIRQHLEEESQPDEEWAVQARTQCTT